MTEKTLTTENIKPAIDALRGELAPWPMVAMKQDRLNDTQKSAVNSGITSGLVAQIIANTAAIRALESAITGTGLRPLVVASLPAIGTQGILYIVPVTTYDPATDADVVNYSNEYIWIVAPDAPVTEGYYEQVGQTGIVINNGQLNITVNGTSVGTFTANQSGDTTAAITVPTNADYVDKTTAQTIAGVKTFSDGIVGNVTGNVTGNLTGTASKAIADEDGTSIKTGYVNVAGNQTVTGNKEFTGINTFNNILPNATNTYSLGSSSYQWSSVYAQTYYYNGTAWGLDKKNTWTNINLFNVLSLYDNSVTYNEAPSSDVELPSIRILGGGRYCGAFDYLWKSTGENVIRLSLGSYKSNGVFGCWACNFGIPRDFSDGGKFGTPAFYPNNNNAYNLGTSTNKWATLNGVNPGALSLPDGNAQNSSWIGDLTIKDGSGYNLKTFTLNGWITINIPNTAGNLIVVNNGCGQIVTNEAKGITGSNCAVFIPVIANVQISVLLVLQTGESVKTAIFAPCLGNV